MEREAAVVVIQCERERAGATVLFAEEEDTLVLGAMALEALSYQVDATTKRLKPTELLVVQENAWGERLRQVYSKQIASSRFL